MVKSAVPFIFKFWATAAIDSHGLNKQGMTTSESIPYKSTKLFQTVLQLMPKRSGLARHQLTSM